MSSVSGSGHRSGSDQTLWSTAFFGRTSCTNVIFISGPGRSSPLFSGSPSTQRIAFLHCPRPRCGQANTCLHHRLTQGCKEVQENKCGPSPAACVSSMACLGQLHAWVLYKRPEEQEEPGPFPQRFRRASAHRSVRRPTAVTDSCLLARTPFVLWR